MNQFYNTRNPADLWLNVGDFKKSYTFFLKSYTLSIHVACFFFYFSLNKIHAKKELYLSVLPP